MPETIQEYVGSHSLLTLATSSSSGEPHAAPCFYANDGLTIYFSVGPTTVSARNLAENAQASVGIADMPDDWSKARGVQITGAVDELEGEEEDQIGRMFQERYPHLGDAALHTHYYRLNADDVHYIHNDEEGEEKSEALGVVWTREHVG